MYTNSHFRLNDLENDMASTEQCANPLLLQWIKEWWDKAREQSSKGVLTLETSSWLLNPQY